MLVGAEGCADWDFKAGVLIRGLEGCGGIRGGVWRNKGRGVEGEHGAGDVG
jgi:hypothetical protein